MTAMQNAAKPIVWGAIFSFAMAFLPWNAAASTPIVGLGTASRFAVLGGAGIANSGTTTIKGDVGSFPTATTAGFGTVTLDGTNHGGDAVTQTAKNDLDTAYADAVGRTPTTIFGAIFDLGGLTLASGVYNDPSSFGISGNLTLDAQGDPNAVWIFQMGSTLITTANSKVILIGGASADNVFWQVGSSATLGADVDFSGNLLAFTSITLTSGVVNGRMFALNGAVTLNNNDISMPDPVPEPSSTLLLGIGLVILFFFGRRFVVRRVL